MKQIVFLSGKGGTGKTTISSSLAAFLEECVAADCDVDGSNMPIALHAKVMREEEFYGMPRVKVSSEMCTKCGLCSRLCQFDAIFPPEVKLSNCEGCMVCMDYCPEGAISQIEIPCGRWFISRTKWGSMVHARLNPGEENSGKLVNKVRSEARKLCPSDGVIVLDGPPGIGCPAISSLTGCDLAVIVVEPSIASLHDSERLLQLVRQMSVKAVLAINKYDLALEVSDKIERFFISQGVYMCGRISFSKEIPKIQGFGKPPLIAFSGRVSDELRQVCVNIMKQSCM